jgi:ATP-binding cassette, subfamily B, bacterial
VFFDHLNISLRYDYVAGTMTAVLAALPAFGQLMLLWVGATQVLNGSITLGTMVALIVLAGAFFAPLASLVSNGQQFQLIGANLDRIRDVTEAEPEQSGRELQPTPRLSGSIRLENVTFRYAPAGPDVLQRLDLTVAPGQRVAIVGHSGSGKSTLGKLLLGLYVPTEGAIFFDDRPLQTLNWQEMRRQFGVVLQESVLFSGSIRSNITLNNPMLEAERVIEAATIAAIHDDIAAMPMGYNTLIGDMGAALSGGQKQRILLARALYKQPRILFLDEATSALDVQKERAVNDAVRALRLTRIIIAHRPETIASAERVIVLQAGRVAQDLRRVAGEAGQRSA